MSESQSNPAAALPPPDYPSERVFARIEGGRVVEIVNSRYAVASLYHGDLEWVDATSARPLPQAGWSYAPTTGFTPPPPPPPPTLAQQALAALAAGVQLTSASTPALNGVYPLDQLSQMRVAAVETGILGGKGGPGGGTSFPWPDAGGVYHVFTTDQFTAFALAMRDYVFELEGVIGGALKAMPPAGIAIP